MPMIASASVTANPIQAVPIIAPRASGCRAVPWMTEAKIRADADPGADSAEAVADDAERSSEFQWSH